MSKEAMKLTLEEFVSPGGGYVPAIPAEQPAQQEPVAWLSTDSIGERYLCFDKPLDNDSLQPLYTSPFAQRPWVGLTEEEKKEFIWLFDEPENEIFKHFNYMKAIEAALRSKNT